MKEKCWDCGRWFDADLMTRREMIVSSSRDAAGVEVEHTGVVDLCPRCAADALRRQTIGRIVFALFVAVVLVGCVVYWIIGGR